MKSTRRRRFVFWPSSLIGQIVFVAALALLFAQAINFALLLEGRARFWEAQATSLATARIALVLDDGTVESRQNRSGRKRGIARLPIRVLPNDVSPPLGEALEEFGDRAGTSLAEFDSSISTVTAYRLPLTALPAEMRPRPRAARRDGRFEPPEPPVKDAVLVRAIMPDGRIIEAVAPVRPREDAAVGWLAMQTFILYLAVLLPLALFAWWVARPLSHLTDKARRFSGNGEDAGLAEQGPADVRRLIAAFNAMQARVGSLLGEKDVMLGAIGHDLKTPLASLRLRIETLDVAAQDEGERERMVATVEEMHAMLDDILMLARLGRSSEPVERTDPAALLSALAEDYAEQGRPVAFEEDNAGRAAPVTLRPLLVRRALRNLIDNALLYGKKARLSLALTPDRLDIRVADAGPGVPEAEMEALFEPFRRAEASRNRATGGSGLGLTIARAIARAHGGDVTLANGQEGGLVAIFSIARG